MESIKFMVQDEDPTDYIPMTQSEANEFIRYVHEMLSNDIMEKIDFIQDDFIEDDGSLRLWQAFDVHLTESFRNRHGDNADRVYTEMERVDWGPYNQLEIDTTYYPVVTLCNVPSLSKLKYKVERTKQRVDKVQGDQQAWGDSESFQLERIKAHHALMDFQQAMDRWHMGPSPLFV